MADKQKLLELDIDVDSIIAKSSVLKDNLNKQREELDKLKKSGDSSSETYVKLEATIKKLSSEYNKNQQQLANLSNGNSKYLGIQEKMNLALDKEIVGINAAKVNNAELKKIRDELNLTTEDGIQAAKLINDKIDENTKFIKANVSEGEKQIFNIGNYTDSIKKAINETGIFTGELAIIPKVLTAMSGPFKLLKEDVSNTWQQMKNAKEGTEGMTVAQKAWTVATTIGTGALRIFTLALAATGIGLIIAAVMLLIGYLKTFTPVVDVVEQSMAGLGAVIKVLQQGIMAFVSGLNDLEGTLKKIGSFLANPIKGFKDMSKAMKEAYDAASDLKKAQQDLEDVMEQQEIQSAKNRAEINRLNIQAKDRTKTDEERLALLNRASQIEKDDFNQRKINAAEQLRIAQQQIINEAKLTAIEVEELKKRGFHYKEYVEGKTNNTDELFDKLKEAQLAQIDLDNEYYSNQEKIINKQNKLLEDQEADREKARQKAEEARQKALDDAASKARAEVDYFLSTQGIKAKSLEEELNIAEQVRDKKLKAAEAEYNASKKTEADKLKLLTDHNNIKDEYLKNQVDVTVKNASRELQLFIEQNKSKIDAQKFFSQASLDEEKRRLDLIAEKNKQFQTLQFEQGILNEQAYQDAIKLIQDETQIKKDEADKLRKEAETERKAIDLENQRAYEDLIFEENLAIQLQRLEHQKAQDIANAEKTGAAIDLINKKYAAAKTKLETEAKVAQISNAQQAISDISTLMSTFFGENKLLSTALATTDMFLSIQKAYLSQLIPGDPTSVLRAQFAGLKAGAFGLANVIRISGVKLAKGTIDLDGPGTSTSDSIPAMLSKGESVMTAKETSDFKPLLKAIKYASASGNAIDYSTFAYPGSVLNTFSNQPSDIDYEKLSAMIGQQVSEANLNLPAPVLGLEEFHSENKKYTKMIESADF